MSCGQPTFRTQRPDQTARVSWLPAGRRRKETAPHGQSESERAKKGKSWLGPRRSFGISAEIMDGYETKPSKESEPSQTRPKPKPGQPKPSQARPPPRRNTGGIYGRNSGPKDARIGWGAYSSPLLIGYWDTGILEVGVSQRLSPLPHAPARAKVIHQGLCMSECPL